MLVILWRPWSQRKHWWPVSRLPCHTLTSIKTKWMATPRILMWSDGATVTCIAEVSRSSWTFPMIKPTLSLHLENQLCWVWSCCAAFLCIVYIQPKCCFVFTISIRHSDLAIHRYGWYAEVKCCSSYDWYFNSISRVNNLTKPVLSQPAVNVSSKPLDLPLNR